MSAYTTSPTDFIWSCKVGSIQLKSINSGSLKNGIPGQQQRLELLPCHMPGKIADIDPVLHLDSMSCVDSQAFLMSSKHQMGPDRAMHNGHPASLATISSIWPVHLRS